MSDKEKKTLANTSKNDKNSSSDNHSRQPGNKIEESFTKVENNNEEEEEEENVSLSKLIEKMDDEEKMMQDADAVLGVADDDVCSYLHGYMKRQALYSCITCQKEKAEGDCLAGVCLACSFKCHEGHQLVELYTKRNFACDCGNKKFSESFSCKLNPYKDGINEKNMYNHNFEGLYCNCGRPYPDPEGEEEEEMVQCVLCEDWFHPKHISPTLKAEDYDEMVCDKCMCKYPFLYLYVPLCHAVSLPVNMAIDKNQKKNESCENNNDNCKSNDENINHISNNKNNNSTVDNNNNNENNKIDDNMSIDVVTPGNDTSAKCPLKAYHDNHNNYATVANTTDCNIANTDTTVNNKDNNINTTSNDNINTATIKENNSNINTTNNNINNANEISINTTTTTAVSTFSKDNNATTSGTDNNKKTATTLPTSSPVYWPANWRSLLCRCTSCLQLYKKYSLDFLLDKEDSLEEYEETGKQMRQQKTGASINKLSYVQQAELLQGYTDLKRNLSDYLKKFAENRKVVREEDISEFFEMQMKKKKKINMQYFCK